MTLSLAHAQGDGGSFDGSKIDRLKSSGVFSPKRMDQRSALFALSHYLGIEDYTEETREYNYYVYDQSLTGKIVQEQYPGLYDGSTNMGSTYKAMDLLLGKLAETSFDLDDKTIKLLFGTEEEYGIYEFISRQHRTEKVDTFLLLVGLVSLSVDDLHKNLTRDNLNFIKTTFESIGVTSEVKLALAEGILNDDNSKLEVFNSSLEKNMKRFFGKVPASSYQAKVNKGIRVTLRY